MKWIVRPTNTTELPTATVEDVMDIISFFIHQERQSNQEISILKRSTTNNVEAVSWVIVTQIL